MRLIRRQGVWASTDGARALVLLQTRATGADTDAQQQACNAVRSAFAQAVRELPPADQAGMRLLLSGPPVFAVAARELIKGEAMKLSAHQRGCSSRCCC